MFCRNFTLLSSIVKVNRSFSTKVVNSYRSGQQCVFLKETEGKEYDLNFSLLEDGVTSVGDSFRNARIALLTSRLPSKVTNNQVTLTSPKLNGQYTIVESGDSISHDNFAALKSTQDNILSSKKDLFVEDAGLSSDYSSRVGVRIITQNPATALLVRKLLIPLPDHKVDHRNRFNGWQNDERWRVANPVWRNDKYDVLDRPEASKGSRPITTFIGGDHDKLAIQFVERNGSIVGKYIYYLFIIFIINICIFINIYIQNEYHNK